MSCFPSLLPWAAACLLALAAASCGTDEPEPGGLDSIPSPVIPDRSGTFLRLDPSELNVEREVTLVFSRTDVPGAVNPFTSEVADTRRDAIYALNYRTGVSRLVVEEPVADRQPVPLPLLGGQSGPAYLTRSLDEVIVHQVDLRDDGVTTSRVRGASERCELVAGEDLFFVSGADLFAARNYATQAPPATAQRINDAAACGIGLYALDGRPVRLARELGVGQEEAFVLSPVDPVTGSVGPVPLAEIPVSDLASDVREPRFVPASDGLYALTSDFVSMELWRVDYRYRPAAAAPAEVEPIEATRVARIDPSFFNDLRLGDRPIAIDAVFGFSVRNGVLALGTVVLELDDAGDLAFGALIVADLDADTVDLIELGGSVDELALFATPR